MEQTDFRDLYAVLELPSDADEATLRRQYRRLAQRYHPDSEAGDTEKFVAIRQAYDRLQDHLRTHGHLPLAFAMPAIATPAGGIRKHAGRRMQTLYGNWERRRRWLVGGAMLTALLYIAWPRQPDLPAPPSVAEARAAGAAAAERPVFGRGATMSEVLDAQGVPDSGSESVWHYGQSTVHFHDGRVVGWKIHPDSPLNVTR